MPPNLDANLGKTLAYMAPAWLTLVATLLAAQVSGELALYLGAQSLAKVAWRFLRVSLVLSAPLALIALACSLLPLLFKRTGWRLVRVRREPVARPGWLMLWLTRPCQGIGLVMLAASKVLVLLQLYSNGLPLAGASTPPPRLPASMVLTVSGAALVASLLLGVLWTLDDLDLRLYRADTGELRRIGRYLGVLLPGVLGFWGIYNLFQDNSHSLALRMVTRMILALYPPFVVFSVLHWRLLQGQKSRWLSRLRPSSSPLAGAETA